VVVPAAISHRSHRHPTRASTKDIHTFRSAPARRRPAPRLDRVECHVRGARYSWNRNVVMIADGGDRHDTHRALICLSTGRSGPDSDLDGIDRPSAPEFRHTLEQLGGEEAQLRGVRGRVDADDEGAALD